EDPRGTLDCRVSIVAGDTTGRIGVTSSNDDAPGCSQTCLALVARLLRLDHDLYLAAALRVALRRDAEDKIKRRSCQENRRAIQSLHHRLVLSDLAATLRNRPLSARRNQPVSVVLDAEGRDNPVRP